eukprot:1973152-Pleurochrysis_carterae.AAC.1
MSSLLAALETSRPIGRRNEGVRTFWYGPPSFRVPVRAGLTHGLRRAQRGDRPCLYLLIRTRLTPPLSHPLTNHNSKSRCRRCYRR